MKKVYIAGKLNDDAVGYIKNMYKMITTADKIRRMGYAVYVPCLDFLSGLVNGNYEYNDYFQNNTPWLLSSDMVFVLDCWESSKGTKAEIEIAEQHNIPVYFDMGRLVMVKFPETEDFYEISSGILVKEI